MYFIITYDIADEQRLNKVRKILRKYFNWVQNSVFEGEITASKLEKCIFELKEVIDEKEDSIYFYEVENYKGLKKTILGVAKNLTDNII
ncbi:MAG: CRISPR-associated endonuclease Cas2 [Candidatus Hydrothermia bacterium]|jgi:CRISPR-associated protein Cas2|nr:CRISPR-associated endonuclease Cas2 [Candidatus Hydrothermia bacterium]